MIKIILEMLSRKRDREYIELLKLKRQQSMLENLIERKRSDESH